MSRSSPAKRKSKGRSFQCSDFPPCSMSFTRSEHLARHIRSHTGEKPFKCQLCQKNFSRLDNLRQHKQTVHAYENFVLSYPNEKLNVRVRHEDLKDVRKNLSDSNGEADDESDNNNNNINNINNNNGIENISSNPIIDLHRLKNNINHSPINSNLQSTQLPPLKIHSNPITPISNNFDLNSNIIATKATNTNTTNTTNNTTSSNLNILISPPNSTSPQSGHKVLIEQLCDSSQPPPRSSSSSKLLKPLQQFRPNQNKKRPRPIEVPTSHHSSTTSVTNSSNASSFTTSLNTANSSNFDLYSPSSGRSLQSPLSPYSFNMNNINNNVSSFRSNGSYHSYQQQHQQLLTPINGSFHLSPYSATFSPGIKPTFLDSYNRSLSSPLSSASNYKKLPTIKFKTFNRNESVNNINNINNNNNYGSNDDFRHKISVKPTIDNLLSNEKRDENFVDKKENSRDVTQDKAILKNNTKLPPVNQLGL
ncbi:hypothetical protein PACTADRAFT_2005 [Pachysolen tannophilus NRRL Y-2460]|uniref:C2H2-type domain-containing protein n=1 Tax=Pachysolen tannophilus NRRL Y-2460 TaxID=669874 RepID=A0A1E4U0I7_PACTA|nr:hypothetical protein PACTADRAFT_2005 [Pachysolen tannophilus NRRL Y-2460]